MLGDLEDGDQCCDDDQLNPYTSSITDFMDAVFLQLMPYLHGEVVN